MYMLLGHLDSAAWAKAIASFRAFMHAINIGARPGASVENASCLFPLRSPSAAPTTGTSICATGRCSHACAVHTARQFARAIIMPNLVPPVTKVAEAASYRERIRRAVPADLEFEPLMTCYLTDGADPAELLRGRQDGVWVAAKLYPAHATTNSAHGVTSMDAHRPRAGGDGEGRHAAARPWRGDRSPTSTSSTARRCSSTRCWHR